MSAADNEHAKLSMASATAAEAAAAAAAGKINLPEDDASVCDDDGYIDLNDPDNIVLDDDEHGGDGGGSDEDEDDDDGADPSQQEQVLDDEGNALSQGRNLNEEGDHLPPVDDCAAVFFDPSATEKVFDTEDEFGNAYPEDYEGDRPFFTRVKPLHAMSAHPKEASLVAVAGESEAVYIVSFPSGDELRALAQKKADARPAPEVKSTKHHGTIYPHGVDPADAAHATLRTTLRGHTDTITTVAFSPNGEQIATGSIDTTVKIWATATGECVHTLTDLSGEVECLLWHPSGLALLAGAQDAQTIMWNAKKGQVAMYYCGHRGTVTGLLWAADYKKILSCSADGSVMLFNAKTSEVDMAITKGLSEDQAGVVSMALIPVEGGATNAAADLTAHSDVVVVGTEDGTMFVINLKTKKVVQKLAEVHSQAVETIVACADPKWLTTCPFFVSVACDCFVAVWNSRDFTLRSKVNVGEGVLTARWFNHNVIVGCSDGVVRFFDTKTFLEPQTFDVPYQKEKRFGDGETAAQKAAKAALLLAGAANAPTPVTEGSGAPPPPSTTAASSKQGGGEAAVIEVVAEEDEDDVLDYFSNRGNKAFFGHRRMIFGMVVNNTNDGVITVSDDGTARIFGLTEE